MNLQRFVNIAYVLVGLLVWVISARFLGWFFDLVWANFDRPLIGADFSRTDLMGLVVGGAAGVALKMNESVNTWALEVANELRKVTWPTWAETKLSTVVVIVTSIVVSAILGLFDAVWGVVTTWLYGIG
jgi:preprotein translocase subunit SecE